MTGSTEIDFNNINLGIYATQGGGYAIYKDGRYVWYADVPNFLGGAKVGDPIPEEWGVAAVNDAAHTEAEEEREDRYLQLEQAAEQARYRCHTCGATDKPLDDSWGPFCIGTDCRQKADGAADEAAANRHI